jgi:hypothetical protein
MATPGRDVVLHSMMTNSFEVLAQMRSYLMVGHASLSELGDFFYD